MEHDTIAAISIIFNCHSLKPLKFEREKITFNGTMNGELFDSSQFSNYWVDLFTIDQLQAKLEKIIPDVLSVAVKYSKNAGTFLEFKTNDKKLEITFPLKKDGEDISVIETLGSGFLAEFSTITEYEGKLIERFMTLVREDIERAVDKKLNTNDDKKLNI